MGTSNEVKLLPDSTSLPATFKSNVANAQHKIYQRGRDADVAAILCITNLSTHFVSVRDVWIRESLEEDDEFAHELLRVIRRDYATNEEGGPRRVHVAIRTQYSSLLRAVTQREGTYDVLGSIMRKDVGVVAGSSSGDGTFRRLSSSEYSIWYKDKAWRYARLDNPNGPESKVSEAAERMIADLERHLPQGHETPGHDFRSLVVEGEIVGQVWYNLDTTASVSYCFDFFVREQFRRKGFGLDMLTAWEKRAKEEGIKMLSLQVYDSNLPAVSMYGRFGFEIVAKTFRLL